MEIFQKNIPDKIALQICRIQEEILHEKTDFAQIKSLAQNGVMFFAEIDENQKILSFCSVQYSGFEWEIYDIATIPEARKHGFAKKIIAEILNFAHKNNAEKIFLEVRESNEAAINLYQKFGFEKYSVRKKYYSDNSENALCMVKTIIK